MSWHATSIIRDTQMLSWRLVEIKIQHVYHEGIKWLIVWQGMDTEPLLTQFGK